MNPGNSPGLFSIACDRLSESLETESGIGVGQHLEQWGNRLRGASESRVICGLEIPRGYCVKKADIWPGLFNLHVHIPSGGKPQKKAVDVKKMVRFATSNMFTRKYTVRKAERKFL